MPTLTALFKHPLCIVISLASEILGHNNDSKVDEAIMEFFMMIFPLDRNPSILF